LLHRTKVPDTIFVVRDILFYETSDWRIPMFVFEHSSRLKAVAIVAGGNALGTKSRMIIAL